MQKGNSLTKFDSYLISTFNTRIKVNKRNSYKCSINQQINCEFLIYSRTTFELQRFFNHLINCHCDDLNQIINHYINNYHITNFNNISSLNQINQYISQIMPNLHNDFYEIKKINQNQITKNCFLLQKYNLTRLNQVILENGISLNMPLSKIKSNPHINFITEIAKMGFELGRNTSISQDEFNQHFSDITISSSLLNQVGKDYFLYSLEPFKGSYASFQIDAGQINRNSILVFILWAHQRRKRPMIFELFQNFIGNLNNYRECVKTAIEKAKEYNITIVGLVSDNLPVQIKAISHNSKKSIQNVYKESYLQSVVHFRCCNHLLALAFHDWLKINDPLTLYEKIIINIINVFKKKDLKKHFKKKIPQICVTRWYSPFNALQALYENRRHIIELYKKPPKSLVNSLITIYNDIEYLFTRGFTEIYPLLFPYLKLTYHLQNDDVSCVHAVLIVEHYLKEMKEHIIKYEIGEIGHMLIKCIRRRMLLNKNVQLYQLASLFTPDGIIRYRLKIKDQYNIEENEDFWHNKEGFISSNINISFQDVDSYKRQEIEEYLKILREFDLNKEALKLKSNKNKKKTEDKLKFIKCLPRQKQLSIKQYIQNAKDTFENYRKQNQKKIDKNDNLLEDSNENKNDSYLSSNSSDSDVTLLKSKDVLSESEAVLLKSKDVLSESEAVLLKSKDLLSESEAALSESEAALSESEVVSSESDAALSDQMKNGVNKNQRLNDILYFDVGISEEEEEEGNEYDFFQDKNNTSEFSDFYLNQKEALSWNNISNLIINNSKYFGLSDEEARNAAIELHNLLITPFSVIKAQCPLSICTESNYMNFWSLISEIKINGVQFKNISKIAFKFWAIPASETGAERAFSKFKWRFPDRRNRIKGSTMMEEIFIEDAYEQRVLSNDNFSETMWELPPHLQ